MTKTPKEFCSSIWFFNHQFRLDQLVYRALKKLLLVQSVNHSIQLTVLRGEINSVCMNKHSSTLFVSSSNIKWQRFPAWHIQCTLSIPSESNSPMGRHPTKASQFLSDGDCSLAKPKQIYNSLAHTFVHTTNTGIPRLWVSILSPRGRETFSSSGPEVRGPLLCGEPWQPSSGSI